jgi:Uma2 family endonuclease
MWANGFTAGCKRGTYLLTLYEKMGAVVAIACRIRVKPDRVRIPDICLFLAEPREQVPTTPPFICIEILSPQDRMSRVEVLRTENPVLELPLTESFR